ncbi:hypothetical protein CsSME_00028537 [Camellia sinensis var. sinensis]
MSMEVYKRAKPYLAMILLQFGYAGLGIISKFGLNKGMSLYTFSVYRNAVAALVFAPFALLFERKVRPRMTTSIFLKIMLLGLLEPVIDQNLFYTGMKYTTATFATAMCNIVPAITFLMAWILRLEKVNLRSSHSQAKVVGTFVTVGGAMIMTLIKGALIGLPWTKMKSHGPITNTSTSANQQDLIKGSLMITASCFCRAAFFILQAITLKSYPAELSLTTLICMLGSLQGTILTLLVERGNKAIWSLSWDTKLICALYGGIICSGVGYCIFGVVMKEKGPVFVTAFSPLSMVIIAIIGSFVLAEQTHVGSVVGAIVIVIGLYLVIWGKSKEEHSSKSDNDQRVSFDQHDCMNHNTETETSDPEFVKDFARVMASSKSGPSARQRCIPANVLPMEWPNVDQDSFSHQAATFCGSLWLFGLRSGD